MKAKIKTTLKRIIKLILRKFGYELRPLNLNGALNSFDYNYPEGVNRFYSNSQLASDYIKNNVPVHIKNLVSILQKKKFNLNDKKVIDIGCGTGHCLKRLQILYPEARLSGTEISDEAIKIALQVTNGIPISKTDILEPLPGQYDFVFCQQVLEHIANVELALSNLWNLTASGGNLIITVPDGRLDSFAGHTHFWSKESLTLLLKKGLPSENIEVDHLPDELSLYALIKKQNVSAKA